MRPEFWLYMSRVDYFFHLIDDIISDIFLWMVDLFLIYIEANCFPLGFQLYEMVF